MKLMWYSVISKSLDFWIDFYKFNNLQDRASDWACSTIFLLLNNLPPSTGSLSLAVEESSRSAGWGVDCDVGEEASDVAIIYWVSAWE